MADPNRPDKRVSCDSAQLYI